MSLIISAKFGEVIKIGPAFIKFVKGNGACVKLYIDAPREMDVDRVKVFQDAKITARKGQNRRE